MAGYNSKFTGQQVDSLLEKAGSSYQKPETGIPQSDLAESTQQILQNVENKVNKEEGKGLSTNDFTDEYKAKVEDSASQEGYFPKMSVGIAANLAGRGEATEQVFTYRPTDGGTSIESGVAKIRRVKGNSVVFNQLSKDEWELQQAAGTVNNREYTLTSMTGSYPGIWCNKGISTPIGHKVLVSVYTRQEGVYAQQLQVNFQGTNVNLQYNESVPDGLVCRDVIFEVTHTNSTNCTLFCITDIPTLIQYKDPQIFDLTAMFGAGNEPNTIEEFRALYPDSYYPYNTGELRNLACSGIKTVGFNLVDKNYFLTGVISGSDTPSQNSNYRYIKVPVFPNTEYYLKDVSNRYYYNSYVLYDSNMNRIIASGKVVIGDKPYNVSLVITTPSNAAYMIVNVHKDFVDTCCVNLHHTGYRDGEYEPYKEVTHSLPLSQITNGEPLRKAGSVYDEINETDYIKRVGVRPYTEGDKNDATLLTDGTNTNYPLAEPIVTPIETPLNLDYQVEDFGTEEALLAEDSAPFSADIVYQFNAVDRIRENTLDIADLLARVIALENAAATTTSIPDIPDITE